MLSCKHANAAIVFPGMANLDAGLESRRWGETLTPAPDGRIISE
jgi:hypothetical protein